MVDEDAKAVVRRWCAAWNQHDVEAAVALLSEAYVRHDANLPEVIGPDAQRQFMQGLFAAFSDMALEEQAIIADGDLVALRLLISGRHTGEFLGIAATDRQVSFQAVDVFRVEGAALAQQWSILDVLGLLRQLGALPDG